MIYLPRPAQRADRPGSVCPHDSRKPLGSALYCVVCVVCVCVCVCVCEIREVVGAVMILSVVPVV